MNRRGRVKNGIKRFARNERFLFESSDGDGQTNNSLDDSLTLEADLNLNVFDFIPDEQGDNFFKQLPQNETPQNHLSKRTFITVCLILTGLLTLSAAYAYLSLSTKAHPESTLMKTGKFCKLNEENLVNIFTKVEYLNKRLEGLNSALDEMINWRNEIMLRKIKNDSFQGNLQLLEQVGIKIEKALNLYDADKVGMMDYALESSGGFVTSIPDTVPYPDRFSYDILGIISIQYSSNPRVLIQPGTLPGQCFAFEGQNGRIRIRLAYMINIIAVTMEHAHFNLVMDISSAPKDFKVYGLETSDDDKRNCLGTFKYRLDRKPLQTFQIAKLNEENSVKYQYVELQILSNHGNPNYTCIYRFRVHGNK